MLAANSEADVPTDARCAKGLRRWRKRSVGVEIALRFVRAFSTTSDLVAGSSARFLSCCRRHHPSC